MRLGRVTLGSDDATLHGPKRPDHADLPFSWAMGQTKIPLHHSSKRDLDFSALRGRDVFLVAVEPFAKSLTFCGFSEKLLDIPKVKV